jgi:cytochrome bd ubiquinol oxidase subunit I
LDATLLSRIQFGFSVGFHFIFPATTLGLALFIVIYESLYLKTRDQVYLQISTLLVRLLAVVYVMGVATGGTLEFSFGTNWGQFSKFAGSVFGVPVAVEGITAFSLEAIFIGVLLFGRARVSPGVYWLSAFLVFFGAHLSGYWIIAANSWMQAPSGYALQDGRAVMTDFFQATFTRAAWLRFEHTVVGCWMAGAAVVCALAAGYLLKNRHAEMSRRMLGVALGLFFTLPLIQLELGHESAVYVDHTQPAKSAAMEGIFQTQRNAPLLAFGLPDERNHLIRFPLGMPGLLSFLVGWSTETRITGLDDIPRDLWPPVNVVFTTFHLMVACGMASIALGLLGAWLWLKKRLYTSRWFLKLLVATFILPYLAVELGWVSTEIGRQPWLVYGLLKTSQGASAVPAGHVLFTLSLLALIYAVLLAVFLAVAAKIIRQGPPAPAGGLSHG